MKSGKVLGLVAVSAMVLMSGCGSSGSIDNVQVTSRELPAEVQAAIDGPASTLSQELVDTLSYMGNEERLAYDVYNYLYTKFGTKQFSNIATKSEYKHITAVQELIQKYMSDDTIEFTNVDLPSLGYINTPIESMEAGVYDISAIQALYDELTALGSESEVDALKVGCIVEVTDISDLDIDIAIAESENATDVVTVFNFLRDGSYKHYRAFDEALKNLGVEDGCCTWSELCHQEYP
ncbi:uncharacterized protein MJ0754 [Hydrogenimonas sp.]|nr:uncharacterized protein MJ0754 [Hydrogenimonas sp.]